MKYDRETLVTVLIYHNHKNYHSRIDIKGCACGWTEPGKSYAEHVADVYEDAVRIMFGLC